VPSIARIRHNIMLVITFPSMFLFFYQFIEFIKVIYVEVFFYIHDVPSYFFFFFFFFFSFSTISIITVMGLYWWCLFSICWANADLSVFNLIFLMCSLYLVVRVLPVWPMCTALAGYFVYPTLFVGVCFSFLIY
jgi:hypothetical protein